MSALGLGCFFVGITSLMLLCTPDTVAMVFCMQSEQDAEVQSAPGQRKRKAAQPASAQGSSVASRTRQKIS